MRAILAISPGDRSVLQARDDVPVPAPGAGEVRIRVTLAACNFMDVLGRRGDYPVPIQYPWIPGSEGVGVIDTVGHGVVTLEPGQRVAFIGSSSYSEFAIAKEATTIPVPDELPDALAAGFPIQGLTAWHVLYTVGHAQPGDWVVIHAAAGGVGGLAVQLASQHGCQVIALASSDEKLEYAKSLGAQHGVNYRAEDFMRAVRRITEGRGVDLVLDSVGQETMPTNFRVLRHFGRVVAYGLASGMPEVSVQRDLFPKSLGIHAFSLYNVAPHQDLFHRSARELIARLLSGALQLRIDALLPLTEAAEAHRRLEDRESMGKLLLEI